MNLPHGHERRRSRSPAAMDSSRTSARPTYDGTRRNPEDGRRETRRPRRSYSPRRSPRRSYSPHCSPRPDHRIRSPHEEEGRRLLENLNLDARTERGPILAVPQMRQESADTNMNFTRPEHLLRNEPEPSNITGGGKVSSRFSESTEA